MVLHGYRDSFKFYVAQDAYFLAAFCQAYKAAAQKAAAQQQLEHVAVLQQLQQGIEQELQLHASYAAVCMAATFFWNHTFPLTICFHPASCR